MNSTLLTVGHNIKMALAEAKEDTRLGIASCRVYDIVYQKPNELQNCVHPPDERKKTIKAPLQTINGSDDFLKSESFTNNDTTGGRHSPLKSPLIQQQLVSRATFVSHSPICRKRKAIQKTLDCEQTEMLSLKKK